MRFVSACLVVLLACLAARASEPTIRPAEPVPIAPAVPDSPASNASPAVTPASTPVPTATPNPTPRLTERDMINILSETQVEQAIAGLRTNFLDPSKADDKELRRAALEGLVRRLSPGVALVMEADLVTDPARGPFVAEILDARIGYIRPGAIDAETLSQTDVALKNFADKKLKAMILDLRNVPASRDFEAAADLSRRFCEKGKLLFSIQKPSAKQERIFTSNMDPLYSGVLVVLTDADTSGSAEVVAAVLRKHARAMVVGSTTSGEAVEFDDKALGDGKVLRVAVSKVVLPDEGSIYPGGVVPDIAAALPAKTQEQIFQSSAEKGVSQFVFETERPRMNEAALVANTNPEIDAELEPPVQADGRRIWDSVLQRAVDLVTAISFYDGSR